MGVYEITSHNSLLRGYKYFEDKKVIHLNRLNEIEYDAIVENYEGQQYNVLYNVKHPRKSTCTCPHAKDRVVICKHKVAVYFEIYPSEANYVKEQIETIEREQEELIKRKYDMFNSRYKEIKEQVDKLTIKELRELLINYMLSDYDNEWNEYD